MHTICIYKIIRVYLHMYVYFSVFLGNKGKTILSLSCSLSAVILLFQNYVKSLAFPGFVENGLH